MLLHRAIATELGAQLSGAWTPPFMKDRGVRHRAKGWHREVSEWESLFMKDRGIRHRA